MTTRIHLYTISPDGKALTCHLCGFTTISPQHVAELYCGHCTVYLEDIDTAADMARKLGIVRDDTSDRLAFFRRLVNKLRGIGKPTNRS